MKPACLNLARQEKAKGFNTGDTDETKTTAETCRAQKCGPIFPRSRRTGNGKQGRAAAGYLCESAASAGKLWPAVAPEARRADRAELRALLPDRQDEKDAPAKTREHPKATAHSRWGVQSEFDLPPVVGFGNSPRVEKSPVFAYCCVLRAVPSHCNACEPYKLYFFAVPIQLRSQSSLSKIQTSPLRKMQFSHGLLG